MTDHAEAGAGPLPPLEPIEALSDAALAALRRAAAEAGYGFETLAAAERIAPAQLDAIRLPLVLWALARQPGPDALLARLFAYDDRVPLDGAARALGPGLLDALVAAGVVALRDGLVAARLRLTPFEGLLLLSDPPEAGPDAVMGPGPTTVMLARLVPPTPGAVLDVGCGAGTLALVAAARGASRAVGVDLSTRAVRLSRVNARLNGSAAEFRAGDLLEPVRGERFDLVVSQPPYVPLPPGLSPTVYLHGGARGDELALRFAAAFPAALREGGRAVLLFDAPVGGGALRARLRAVLRDAPVDLVVLAAPGPSADLQAVGYAAVRDRDLGARYREALRTYRDHLAASGTVEFARALVLLRASDEPGGRLTVELPVPALHLDASALARYLAALDLAGAPEPALLRARVLPAPELRLREERDLAAPDAAPVRAAQFTPGWIGTDRQVGDAGAFLLEALARAGSVGEVVPRYVEAGAEAAGAQRAVVDFVREALARGLVIPAPARETPR